MNTHTTNVYPNHISTSHELSLKLFTDVNHEFALIHPCALILNQFVNLYSYTRLSLCVHRMQKYAAVPVETEGQAKAKAKALAKKDYLATYNAAIKVRTYSLGA